MTTPEKACGEAWANGVAPPRRSVRYGDSQGAVLIGLVNPSVAILRERSKRTGLTVETRVLVGDLEWDDAG